MCWVALDRAIRIAERRAFPADWANWIRTRDEIYLDIMNSGWCKQRQAFVQAYGSDSLDAANLMLPLVLFVAPNDPRMLSTLDAMCKDPADGGLLSNSLVYRYNTDQNRLSLALSSLWKLRPGLAGLSCRSNAVVLTAFCSSVVRRARPSVKVSAMRNPMFARPLHRSTRTALLAIWSASSFCLAFCSSGSLSFHGQPLITA